MSFNWVIYSYALEMEQIKGTVASETFKDPAQRVETKKVR